MTTDVTVSVFPDALVRAFTDVAAALDVMAQKLNAAMGQASRQIASFTACLPRLAHQVERPVDRARRLRLERWARRRDRRAARRASRIGRG